MVCFFNDFQLTPSHTLRQYSTKETKGCIWSELTRPLWPGPHLCMRQAAAPAATSITGLSLRPNCQVIMGNVGSSVFWSLTYTKDWKPEYLGLNYFNCNLFKLTYSIKLKWKDCLHMVLLIQSTTFHPIHTHTHTQTLLAVSCCLRFRLNHQEQFGVQCLYQAHFDIRTGGAWGQSANLEISGQPAPPAEPPHVVF